jgi:hypothetical protein
VAGLGVERDFAAAGHANSLGDAGDLSLAEAGETARLALVGHDAFPTACAQVSILTSARIFIIMTASLRKGNNHLILLSNLYRYSNPTGMCLRGNGFSVG